jgi:hypothetical protein
MKKLIVIMGTYLLLFLTPVTVAQEYCNPSPNTVSTGEPYCDSTGQVTTQTLPPDKINNALPPEPDSNVNFSTLINIDPWRYIPQTQGAAQGPMNIQPGGGQYLQQNQPYYNQGQGYLNGPIQNNQYQLLPNSPLDNRPLTIPHSATPPNPADLPPHPYNY